MYSLLRKTPLVLPLWGAWRGCSRLCTRVVQRFHFQTVVEFLVCQLCDLEQVHWKGQYLYTSGRQDVWWRKLRSRGLLLVKTSLVSSYGGAGGWGRGRRGIWTRVAVSFVQRPTPIRGHPATPAHKVLQQSSWPSAVENWGRASTLSLGSCEDFTEVLFKLRPAKWLGVCWVPWRGRGDGSCTAFALECQALKPGRQSPAAQWPGPPGGRQRVAGLVWECWQGSW